jgi:phosphatidylserine/phosphatidylglycerophosphate/cardiolipin synthase-like enzyme
MGETLFLRDVDPDGNRQLRRVDLQSSVDRGLLLPCSPESEAETSLYVSLATALDDGEAMALAIAKSRAWRLATDDRLAIRYAKDLGVPILTTPELMKRWADALSADINRVRAALRRIQVMARFVPSPSFPMHGWWVTQLGSLP